MSLVEQAVEILSSTLSHSTCEKKSSAVIYIMEKTLNNYISYFIFPGGRDIKFFFIFVHRRHPGTKTRALNLASYNYLGFAENSGPCAEAAEQAVRRYGVAGCSARNEYGE